MFLLDLVRPSTTISELIPASINPLTVGIVIFAVIIIGILIFKRKKQ